MGAGESPGRAGAASPRRSSLKSDSEPGSAGSAGMRRRAQAWQCPSMLAVAIVVYSVTLLTFSALFARAPNAKNLPSCASSRYTERPGTLLGPPIQFVHLAKSGGTTLRLAFRAWTKAANITLTETGQSYDHYQSTAKRSHKLYGVFVGHRGWGFSWKLPSSSMKIVILREPISRLISKFDYVQREHSMFRRNHTFYWINQTIDDAIAHYAQTRQCCAESLLPTGDASEQDKAFHHLLLHVLQYMAGWQFVWGPGAGGNDRALPPAALLELAQRNLAASDVVVIYPEYVRQLVPQLEFQIPWIPKDAGGFFESHYEKKRPPYQKASMPSSKSLALLAEWTREERVLFEWGRVIAEEKTRLAESCVRRRREMLDRRKTH